MNKEETEMKKYLKQMLEALIADDTERAAEALRTYLSAKSRTVLGEGDVELEFDRDEENMDRDEEDMDMDMDRDEEDMDRDEEDMDMDREELDGDECECSTGDEEDMDMNRDEEDMPRRGRGREEMEPGVTEGLANAYSSKPHKSNSAGYGYKDVKRNARKLNADTKSGANEKKGNAYKDKPHKDNSEKYGYDKVKKAARAGLKDAPKGVKSPDSDGTKENRRTDRTAKYHGQSREGRPIGEKWEKEVKVSPAEKGKHSKKSVAQLKKELAAAKKAGDTGLERELNFAIRAKTGWGKVNK